MTGFYLYFNKIFLVSKLRIDWGEGDRSGSRETHEKAIAITGEKENGALDQTGVSRSCNPGWE